MLQTAFVMFGSGLAGMLLFLVGAKGTPTAMAVSCLTPLPIMIAALGWGHLVGLGAALLGVFLIGVLFEPFLGLYYAGVFALPAWWLAYLGLLARFTRGPSGQPRAAEVKREWYSLGTIVLWAASIGCGVALLFVLSVSRTSAGFDTAARSSAARLAPLIEKLFGETTGLPEGISAVDFATVLIHVMPIAGAASLTLTLVGNLWLAGRAVLLSQRLPRPWSDVPENLRLPRPLLLIFPIVVAGAVLLHGYGRLFSTIVAAAFGVPLMLLGLAVVHALTRRRPGRPAILAALYASLLMLMPWSAIILAIVGLLDIAVSLRARFAVAPSSPPRS